MKRDERPAAPDPLHGAARGTIRGGLSGLRVVITRAQHQAQELSELLTGRGAEPLFYPCIEIVPPEDTTPLDEALQEAAAGAFDWLVVTSTNTALTLSRRLAALGCSLGEVQVAAVGPKTSEAISNQLRIDVDLVAPQYVADSLAAALQPATGQRILLPQSKIARPLLADTLRSAGAYVTVVDAYETVMGQGGDDVASLLALGTIDAITFTSSSTVRYFLLRLDAEGGRRADLHGVCLAAIGPVTARTMQRQGLAVDVTPMEYTLPSMVAALESYFQQKGESANDFK